MSSRYPACWLAIVCLLSTLVLTGSSAARADDDGQATLDQATEAKLSADSMEDLSEVIRLCRSAIKRGLDEQNKKFATEMLAGTLTQRGEAICGAILDRPTPSARWPELRRMALADLEESVELNHDQADAHYMIGRLHALPGGDRELAIKSLDQAVRLTDNEPAQQARALLVRANLTTDDEARRADYNRAIKLAPRNAEVIRARGLYNLTEDKYDEAIADFDKAIELDPTNADTFEAKGVAQFWLKDYDAALETLGKAIELDPDAAVPYAHRGRIYAVQKNNDKALAELDHALKLDRRNLGILLLRARVYMQAGDFKHALEDVNEVLRLSPGMGEALQLHASLAANSGKIDQAISDLEELKTMAPENTELLLQLGMFYTADKQPEKAIETFGDVLTKDPKSWLALRGRADAYLSLGKQSDAIGDYESALKLQPENSGILNNLAWVLATSPEDKLRNGKRAIELASQACKLTHNKEAHILSTLAAAYAETGDFENAILWSEKSVSIGSSEMKPQLGKELASYQQHKPWREEQPPVLATEHDEQPDGEATKVSNETPADDSAAPQAEGKLGATDEQDSSN